MKLPGDPERLDALENSENSEHSESEAALGRALKALAQDRPTSEELARVRRRLQLALTQQTTAHERAALLQPAAGLIVVGAALLSMLPSAMRQPEAAAHSGPVEVGAPSAPSAPSASSASSAPSASTEARSATTQDVKLPDQAVVAPPPAPVPHAPRVRAGHLGRSVAPKRPMDATNQTARQEPDEMQRTAAGAGVSAKVDQASAQSTTHDAPGVVATPASHAISAADAQLTATKSPLAVDEVTLLQRARAQADDDPRAALRWLEEHKRRYPNGMLSQEREVLAIRFLQATSQDEAAAKRVQAFRRDYPRSIYLPRVEKAQRRE